MRNGSALGLMPSRAARSSERIESGTPYVCEVCRTGRLMMRFANPPARPPPIAIRLSDGDVSPNPNIASNEYEPGPTNTSAVAAAI